MKNVGVLSCETDYGKLQKCYSIWICYDPKIPKKLKNTACRYSFTKEDIFGTVEEDESNYDLMEVVIVMLDTSADTDYKLLDYLKGVLTYDKEKIMEQAGQLSPQAEKEVEAMSGVGSMIRNLGREEGKNEGLKALVKSLKAFIKDFNQLYAAVIENEEYADMTEEQVKKYY